MSVSNSTIAQLRLARIFSFSCKVLITLRFTQIGVNDPIKTVDRTGNTTQYNFTAIIKSSCQCRLIILHRGENKKVALFFKYCLLARK